MYVQRLKKTNKDTKASKIMYAKTVDKMLVNLNPDLLDFLRSESEFFVKSFNLRN